MNQKKIIAALIIGFLTLLAGYYVVPEVALRVLYEMNRRDHAKANKAMREYRESLKQKEKR
jgi:hypothetical protein